MRSRARASALASALIALAPCASRPGAAQTAGTSAVRSPQSAVVLRPSRVFDGTTMHAGWSVVVQGDRIIAAGPSPAVPSGARVHELPGATLLPGLIEAHSHLLLHPYDETSWDDQVLKESQALRVARAVVHARRTLDAGFTTIRDLGTEGAGAADVGIRDAIAQGIIPGPRVLTTTRAIVATGSYAPKGFDPAFAVPQGAEEGDGAEALTRIVRDQIGKGADWIKVYADYRWGPGGETRPTFTERELATIVEVAQSSGRRVVAHAYSPEGIRRAVMAGVSTIEHGGLGTPEVFRLMAQRGVALCPTLSAGEAIEGYRGWRKGVDPDPDRIRGNRAAFRAALAAGVTICNGSDVGVFAHGDNARELGLLVEYGMTPLQALRAATSVNARVLGLTDRGTIAAGQLADLVIVNGDPATDIGAIRAILMVMKGGVMVVEPPR